MGGLAEGSVWTRVSGVGYEHYQEVKREKELLKLGGREFCDFLGVVINTVEKA